MTETSYTIAMIGAGPASLYATEVLAEAGHEVVILNRDIKPGGLAEFGIYPTKYRMKSGLRKVFYRILERENVHYFGNITVGDEGDVSLDELEAMGVDALVVAVGAQGTKWLGLPGEEADAVFHAKDLVYHYNGLPPFSERPFAIGKDVAVIGLGNVCLDIVHWMVCEQQVDSVTAVARRGPAERKFTRKEYRLVSGAIDEEALDQELAAVAPIMEAIGQDTEKVRKELFRFLDFELETESDTKFRMRFLRNPVRIEVDGDGQVTGLTCEKTRLVAPKQEGGRVGLEKTKEFETIPCDTVVFAIGDAIEPSLGLPLSPQWSGSFATVDEAWAAHPERPRYMVADPSRGEPMWGTFVVGWARKASDGLVGKARADAVQGCDEILAYLNGEFDRGPDSPTEVSSVLAQLHELFEARQLKPVDYADTVRLLAMEKEEAKRRGLQEYKFSSTAEMLRRLELN